MSVVLSALLAAALQAAPASGWSWTLYESDGPLVLAEEIPDTTRLRTTLECQPGTGAVMLHLYTNAAAGDFARITAGQATAASEARVARGRLETSVRVDHPAFIAFVAGEPMTVVAGAASNRVVMPAEHLPRLRRFADRCAG